MSEQTIVESACDTLRSFIDAGLAAVTYDEAINAHAIIKEAMSALAALERELAEARAQRDWRVVAEGAMTSDPRLPKAMKLLEALCEPHEQGDEHEWRKCRRCLAINMISGEQPRLLLALLLDELRQGAR